MTATDQRTALLRTLRGMIEALDAPHADVAARLQRVADDLDSAPPGPLPDRLLRRVRRLREGTMGSLSDVVFAQLRDGRWVPDPARTERWTHLSRQLRDDVARLPPAEPPDLFLVSDRLRECWLFEPGSIGQPPWHVDVFPPLWLSGQATADDVRLRPTGQAQLPADNLEVSIVWGEGGEGDERVLGTGRLFSSRVAAQAALGRA